MVLNRGHPWPTRVNQQAFDCSFKKFNTTGGAPGQTSIDVKNWVKPGQHRDKP